MSYGNAKWWKVSRRYLRAHPVCEEDDCREPSKEVHHIDGLGFDGPRGFDETNFAALCKSHHSKITASRAPRRRPPEEHPGLLGK